jgi:hypothetical protein
MPGINHIISNIKYEIYVINKASISNLVRKVYGGMPVFYHENPKIIIGFYVTNKASYYKKIRCFNRKIAGINHRIPKKNSEFK